MSPINIIFATPTYSKLNWLDSCEGVGEEEIRDLILFLRGALAALSAELDDRRNTRKDENLESYKRMLWETAKQINEQGLTETHERCLGSLGSFLAQAEVERKESKFDKATRQYLWLISKAIGWPWVRFIWCALGKCKVKHLNEGQRIKLVKYIAKHRESFFCRSLEDRVVQCQSQEIYIKADHPPSQGSKKRKRQDGATNRKSTPVTPHEFNLQILVPGSFQDTQGTHTSAFNSCSAIRASEKRKRKAGKETATDGATPVPASRRNDIVTETTTHSNSIAPDVHRAERNTKDCLLLPKRSISNTDKNLDHTPHDPSHSPSAHVNFHSSLPPKTQQGPRAPTPLPSQEHKSSSTPNQNCSDEWEKLLITDHTEDPSYLHFLLHAMGGSNIPGLLLDRVLLPQRRWNSSGVGIEVTALEAGLDQRLLDVLSDTERRKQAIDPFVKSDTTKGTWALSLESHFQSRISQLLDDQEKEKWSIEAFKWICFVFPRDQLWESQPSFTSVVKLLITPLIHTLKVVKQGSVATRVRNEALETLFVASKVGNLQSRRNALTMATHFLKDESPSEPHAEMAHQQSNLSRLAANFVQSERFIHDFCCRCGYQSDECIPRFYRQLQPERVSKRLNALYGRLQGSHLENLVQCEKYNDAIEEVDDWRTSKYPSLMECRVLPSRAVTIAKIYRSQGMFADARSGLENCLTTLFPQDTNRCQVLCSLADVYCDLRLPDKAHNLLIPEVEKERKKASKTKSFRRLLVTLIDTNIQKCHYDDAIGIIAELGDTFNHLSNLDVSDQLLHVRSLVASARICHCQSQFREALRRWEVALSHVQKYKSFEGEGFTYAIIHLSISLAHLESGDIETARKAHERAEMICSRGMRDFWIPTLAAWGQLMGMKIRSLTGWEISTET